MDFVVVENFAVSVTQGHEHHAMVDHKLDDRCACRFLTTPLGPGRNKHAGRFPNQRSFLPQATSAVHERFHLCWIASETSGDPKQDAVVFREPICSDDFIV